MKKTNKKQAATKSQQTNADITALLKARNTLLWITTPEEARVERAIIESAGKASFEVVFWDCAMGLSRLDENGNEKVIDPDLADPTAIIAHIREHNDRCVYVLRDMHKWLDGVVLRGLRSLARYLQGEKLEHARAIVVLTPSGEIPPELAGHTTVIDYPLPERAEVAEIFDDVISALPEGIAEAALAANSREAAIDAAIGLTAEEAANCFAKSLVTSRKIDPAVVSGEKKRVIARERVLTWYDPDPRGLDAIGGLDLLKRWLTRRKGGLTQRAREFGLPSPRGCMIVGISGCGKSLTPKALAAAWNYPLLRFDFGALRAKWVGESEANIRKALAVAEAVAPCVLWADEIEKALAGSSSAGDSGVAADALGTFLTWMQERTAPVFVVATANDVSALPPELLRKGRFDEMFFVDLPNAQERVEILRTALRQFGRDPDSIDCAAVKTDGFAGAEIAALVPEALFEAFADDERALTTEDLQAAAELTVPLSKTAAEKIERLRSWAKERARPASSEEKEEVTAGRKKGRKLDL